jgi:hypothetical protein
VPVERRGSSAVSGAGASALQAQRREARQISQADQITLEFDLPPGFADRAPNGGFVLSALQVGYFGPDGTLLRAVEVPREAIRATGKSAQVSIPRFPLPRGNTRVNIRLRGLSSGRPGEWSQPVGPISMPEIPVPTRAERAARTRGIDPRQMDRRTALQAALQPLLATDFGVEEALGSYGGIQELGTAVVLSRKHGLSFSQLSRTVKGPPVVSLAAAVRKLRPSLDATKVVQDARLEARTLVAREPNPARLKR